MTKIIMLIIILGLVITFFVRKNANTQACKINSIKTEEKMGKIIVILKMEKYNPKVFIIMESLKEKIFHSTKMETF